MAHFAKSATRSLLQILKQNWTKLEISHSGSAKQTESEQDPEEIVVNMVESFMNLNNLAVDLKSKQSNSGIAGDNSALPRISKVSQANLTFSTNFCLQIRLSKNFSAWC